MASLARRLAPAAALGGLAIVIVGVADPALAGHTEATATGTQTALAAVGSGTTQSNTQAQPNTQSQPEIQSQPDTTTQSDTSTQASGEVTGQVAMTRWGPVQVAGTVADGRLTEVHAVVWPTGDGRSIAINDYAIPILDSEASQVGTSFDYVSGATYTSEGYRQSLQSLLDSL
jgi:uncharacterized protein with FMN-binding domain